MFIGLQIIGIVFGLTMSYLTFVYYKRRDYDIEALFVWLAIWIGFIILAAFPSTVYGIMQELQIQRTVDFFVISGFLIFSVLLFKSYGLSKKNQKQIEALVRKLALKRGEERIRHKKP
ncbi:DUF2304 domain-containing protein [Candidatus Woesearchaeota archaeon]|nr:DUF2304 domain-containing protein [Candidatus Woesearchaeota archaeon]